MQIRVTRTGGFAGITEDLGTFDTVGHTPLAARVEEAVRQIDFFNLPETVGGIGADMFRYEITVSDGPRRHTVSFVDDGSAEGNKLRHLAQLITPQIP